MNERVRKLNDAPAREKADFVLYWSQMNRRGASNHALDFAIRLANERHLPVLFYEGLTCTYKQANDRLHTFILEGVPDTRRAVEARGIGYSFYLRRRKSDPNDIVYKLASRAAAVVTDDYPTFINAAHNAGVPGKIEAPYYAVDSSCIVPMNCFTKREYAAYTIRPKINKLLPQFLQAAEELKPQVKWRGPAPDWDVHVSRECIPALTASCEIDRAVKPSTAFTGGSGAAAHRLEVFLDDTLRRYAKEKNNPASHATSNLSPYLHFGHISSLDIALQAKEHAREHKLIADEFLEELIVRRELAFNYARFAANIEGFADLPDWARKTMAQHAADPRDPCYDPDVMERAETGDPLWNATQKELLLRGKIHGYYRMYWGKKIIEWSRNYQEALDLMIHLHDRYALDGRDPNTYTNILWCFGLHDRPWFDRPIFGVMRYMSFEGMKRKTGVDAYIQEITWVERTGDDPLGLKP